jgi:ABC-type uncharacterized transport system ATPase component
MSLKCCGLGVFLLLLSSPVLAQDKVTFAGKWAGEWKNSIGEKGTGTLTLKEGDAGKVSATWGDDLVQLTGKRVNKNTIELQGKTDARSFQGIATVKGDTLTLKLLITRLGADREGAFDSTATLKRNK